MHTDTTHNAQQRDQGEHLLGLQSRLSSVELQDPF
jgi:hypothetical protein